MFVVRAPLLRVEVRVSVVGSVPDAVLEGVGRHLEIRLREVVFTLVVVKLEGAEPDLVARRCTTWWHE